MRDLITDIFDSFVGLVQNVLPVIIVAAFIGGVVLILGQLIHFIQSYRPSVVTMTVSAHQWRAWQAQQRFGPYVWYTQECSDSTVNGTPSKICTNVAHTDNRWQDIEPLEVWGAVGEPIVYPEPYTLGTGNAIGNVRPLPKRGLEYYVTFKQEDGGMFNYPIDRSGLDTYPIGTTWVVPVDIFGNGKIGEMYQRR